MHGYKWPINSPRRDERVQERGAYLTARHRPPPGASGKLEKKKTSRPPPPKVDAVARHGDMQAAATEDAVPEQTPEPEPQPETPEGAIATASERPPNACAGAGVMAAEATVAATGRGVQVAQVVPETTVTRCGPTAPSHTDSNNGDGRSLSPLPPDLRVRVQLIGLL